MSFSVSYNAADSYASAHDLSALQPTVSKPLAESELQPQANAQEAKQLTKIDKAEVSTSVSNKSMSLDVNSPDYKIKVMVEREIGDHRQQTVLNFYKRGTDPESHQGLAMDTKA